MIVESSPDVFDKMRTDASSNGPFSIEQSKSGYIQNDELAEGKHIASNSRAAYHLERAQKSGNIDSIKEYPEPIGYKFSISKSGMVFKKTVKMTIVRLSILKLLAQGGTPNVSSQKHKYEFLFSKSGSDVEDMKDAIREKFEG